MLHAPPCISILHTQYTIQQPPIPFTMSATSSLREPENRAASAPAAAAGPRDEAMTAGTTTTRTMTITEQEQQQIEGDDEILTLSLTARPSVRWDESVVDNEGMGRKSSKRCCIFHKQRNFGESSTDSSDHEYDSDKSGSSTASGAGGDDGDKKPRHKTRKHGKIARPKKSSVPDFQRFHA